MVFILNLFFLALFMVPNLIYETYSVKHFFNKFSSFVYISDIRRVYDGNTTTD